MIVITNATGFTYSWTTTVKWPGGTAPTASGNTKKDIITLLWDGTDWLGSYVLNM